MAGSSFPGNTNRHEKCKISGQVTSPDSGASGVMRNKPQKDIFPRIHHSTGTAICTRSCDGNVKHKKKKIIYEVQV